jgi:predicted acylesterase/phospholipase RssA
MDAGGTVLVLGAGGARGAALAGVLRRLRAEAIAFDAIVGSSVGAIVGAMYAGAGLDPDEMLEAARGLGPLSLLSFGLSRWRLPLVSARAAAAAASLPASLSRLEEATFAELRHGVRRLGVLVYDLLGRREVLILGGPDRPAPLPLPTAVKASASIPGLFPPLTARLEGRRRWLCDPGWFTAVPLEHAFAPPLRARRVIAVDLGLRVCRRQARPGYWDGVREACGDRLVVLRPRVEGSGTILPRRGDAERLAAAGEEAVESVLPSLRAWERQDLGRPEGSSASAGAR